MPAPKLKMRYINYPVIDNVLVEVNEKFGVDIVHRWTPSKEDREIANRFDVAKALREAEEAIKLKDLGD